MAACRLAWYGELVANYYNGNMAAHGGKLTAVYTHKNLDKSGEFIAEAGVQDVERGALKGISPLPWQTDTSIGDCFYNENSSYKSTTEIIHTLADVVQQSRVVAALGHAHQRRLPVSEVRVSLMGYAWLRAIGSRKHRCALA